MSDVVTAQSQITSPTRRVNAALWKPGQSGNPGGRPAILKNVQELARQHTPEAVNNLAQIMNDKRQNGTARVAAAKELLDRAWGKAPATLDIQGKLTLEMLVNAAAGVLKDDSPVIDAEPQEG